MDNPSALTVWAMGNQYPVERVFAHPGARLHCPAGAARDPPSIQLLQQANLSGHGCSGHCLVSRFDERISPFTAIPTLPCSALHPHTLCFTPTFALLHNRMLAASRPRALCCTTACALPHTHVCAGYSPSKIPEDNADMTFDGSLHDIAVIKLKNVSSSGRSGAAPCWGPQTDCFLEGPARLERPVTRCSHPALPALLLPACSPSRMWLPSRCCQPRTSKSATSRGCRWPGGAPPRPAAPPTCCSEWGPRAHCRAPQATT